MTFCFVQCIFVSSTLTVWIVFYFVSAEWQHDWQNRMSWWQTECHADWLLMNTLVAVHVLSNPRALLNTVTAPRFVSGVKKSSDFIGTLWSQPKQKSYWPWIHVWCCCASISMCCTKTPSECWSRSWIRRRSSEQSCEARAWTGWSVWETSK